MHLVSSDGGGNAVNVCSNDVAVLDDRSASLGDLLGVGVGVVAVGLGGGVQLVDGGNVGVGTALDLGNLGGIRGNELGVALGSGGVSVETTIQETGVLSNHGRVELADRLVGLHDAAVDGNRLGIEGSHVVGNGEHLLVQAAAMVEVGELRLVDHCLAIVGLDLVIRGESGGESNAVAEDLLGVLIGELSVSKEGCVVVLVDQRGVLGNDATSEVSLGLVVVHHRLELKDGSAVRSDLLTVLIA